MLKSLEECASVCNGVSSMFVFGTNDFGNDNQCNIDSSDWRPLGCLCYCETSATAEGTCNSYSHNGYRLYKYTSGGYHTLYN